MLTVALALMLHGLPVEPAYLSGDVHSRVRLVDALGEPLPNYETWSRNQLREEYDKLDELRPGIAWQLTMMLGGTTGAAICGIWLGSSLSSFFGIEVALLVGLSVAIIVFAGVAILGTILLVRLWPERKAVGARMDAIEGVYRAGYWRGQQRPCPETPAPREPQFDGPGPTVPPPPRVPPVATGDGAGVPRHRRGLLERISAAGHCGPILRAPA